MEFVTVDVSNNTHLSIFLSIFKVPNKETKLHLFTPGFMLTCANRHLNKEINGKLHFDPFIFIRHYHWTPMIFFHRTFFVKSSLVAICFFLKKSCQKIIPLKEVRLWHLMLLHVTIRDNVFSQLCTFKASSRL